MFGEHNQTFSCIEQITAVATSDANEDSGNRSHAVLYNVNSHNTLKVALDDAWASISGERSPMVIIELICEMACPRHEWLSAPGFSGDAYICARDASRVVLAKQARPRVRDRPEHARNFAIGGFSFSQGFRYVIEIIAHTKCQDITYRDRACARVGLFELLPTVDETPKAIDDSVTHLRRNPDTEKVSAKVWTVPSGIQPTRVKIAVDFTDDELQNNAHFEIAAKGTFQRKLFHVNPPCVLFAEGTNAGVSVIRVNSVTLSK